MAREVIQARPVISGTTAGVPATSVSAAIRPVKSVPRMDSWPKTSPTPSRPRAWRFASRAEVPVPLYLAGGLRADNVAEAIATVGPFAVDVCTGVRTDGRLDEVKLAAFVAALDTVSAGSRRSP